MGFSLSSLRSDVSGAWWCNDLGQEEVPSPVTCVDMITLTLGTGAAGKNEEKGLHLQLHQGVCLHSPISTHLVAPVEFPADSLH